MIKNTHKNVDFYNTIIGAIPRSGVIDPGTINPNDLCYKWSKHGPYCLYGKLRNKDFNDEPHFPLKKLISDQIQMNTLLKANDKIRKDIW